MTKVLIVEDNEMNRDILGRRLTRRGYDILFAVNGEEAVEMASSQLPDIILMDLSIPLLNGWEVTKRIRTMEKISQIPIIALTAHAMSGDREKAIDAGCDDYIPKPIDFEGLIAKMELLLKKDLFQN